MLLDFRDNWTDYTFGMF